MTPTELQTWTPLLDSIAQKHPEWIIVEEQTPQSSGNEKLNANAAAGTMPDVQELEGVPDVLSQGAFLPLDDYVTQSGIDKSDFFPNVLGMYTSQGHLMALPFVASPEVLYYNMDEFDAAKLPYPTNSWTMADFEKAAILLTLDNKGRNPTDPNFDSKNIKQWGFNTNPGSMGSWATPTFLQPWGGTFCANPDCTQLKMLTPANETALNFWYDLVVTNHASLSDPYSGAQTGVPGDPFISGFTAMGYDGYFAVGVLKTTTTIRFGIVQPPLGPSGHGSGLSARGYAIAKNSKYPDEAWKLIQELTTTDFLTNMWTLSGNSVPARRSAAKALTQLKAPPADLSGVLMAAEYASPFVPLGPGSVEAYIKTSAIGVDIFSGKLSIQDGYTQMEQVGNAALQP
jgi:multiple sugar transport system substrate-binding protein